MRLLAGPTLEIVQTMRNRWLQTPVGHPESPEVEISALLGLQGQILFTVSAAVTFPLSSTISPGACLPFQEDEYVST